MTTHAVYNQAREQVGEIELDASVFDVEPARHLLHLVVRKQRAAKRAGTHAAKRRAEISGGGRKPFKQKGTGHARQGSIRAPHYRGGGVVFGPVPRSHDFKVNKKEMRAALRSALSLRVQNGEVFILDTLTLESPKTKGFKELLGRFELGDALFVDAAFDSNVALAARNLQEATLLPPVGVNVYDVLRRDRLVLTRAAVDAIVARLGGDS